jgi:hypothetical protein
MKYCNFLEEQKRNILHVFDMDETLFHYPDPKTEAKIHVVNSAGKRVKSLTNVQFNNHKLEPNHKYDFSEFKSTDTFIKSAHPINKMIHRLKNIHRRNPHVEILTARSDMDDKHKFGHHLKKHGIDINKVHVRRAGNLDKGTPAERKKNIVSNLIHKHGYHEVHLYDDSKDNLTHFLSLKHHHPNVKLVAHHVEHDKTTGDTQVNKAVANHINGDSEYGGMSFYSPDERKIIKDNK